VQPLVTGRDLGDYFESIGEFRVALGDITREGVLTVIDEYREIGQSAFFERYGFRAATKYWIVHEGAAYASKAVANVAQAVGMKRPYAHDIRIAGGEATVVRRLKGLGFSVPAVSRKIAQPRSDTWSREELVLALDLYMRSPQSPASKTSREVAELTKLLGKLAALRGGNVGPKFRNENGVYLKMMNFRRFDPIFLAQGKTGMQRGGKLEEEIWNEFANDVPGLREAAALIRASISDPVVFADLQNISTDDSEGVEEGDFSYRLHKRYERNRKIVDEKKSETLATLGHLRCECCEFDFADGYGELGFGYIEAHHRKPVFKMKPGEKTRLSDLALLCSNCHRMIHSRREPLEIGEVRLAVRARRAAQSR
jgi:5-methylcytosine-specific restriction enzyme A